MVWVARDELLPLLWQPLMPTRRLLACSAWFPKAAAFTAGHSLASLALRHSRAEKLLISFARAMNFSYLSGFWMPSDFGCRHTFYTPEVSGERTHTCCVSLMGIG